MADVLAFLLLLTAGALASVIVAAALVLRALRRRARVSPRVSTGAPVRWLWSPLPLARLHRRLRAAVRLARNACPPVTRRRPRSTVHELADDVEELAVTLDLRLVEALHEGAAYRTVSTLALASEVARLEGLATRVAAYGSLGCAPSRVTLDGVDERLRALEAAQAEIDGLDLGRLGRAG